MPEIPVVLAGRLVKQQTYPKIWGLSLEASPILFPPKNSR